MATIGASTAQFVDVDVDPGDDHGDDHGDDRRINGDTDHAHAHYRETAQLFHRSRDRDRPRCHFHPGENFKLSPIKIIYPTKQRATIQPPNYFKVLK